MNDQLHIYWVGPRKSDISAVTDVKFFGSVTIFGDGKDNNYAYCLVKDCHRVNHNLPDKKEDQFFYDTIAQIIKEDKSARFYFYNPNAVYYIDGLDKFLPYFLCVNPLEIMKKTNDKRDFQSILQEKVPLLDRRQFHRSNCNFNNLLETFGYTESQNKKFVFQAPISSGGNGTYLVSKDTKDSVLSELSRDGKYLVSVYEDRNIPVNIHAIIFDDHILLSPGSIQIMREDDERLLYRGADFFTYRTIPEETRKKFESNVKIACQQFQQMGYRGVCGIDGIICADEIRLLEINNRFQASSGLVDLSARESGIPSLQYINLAAFTTGFRDEFLCLETLEVNYSNYFFTDNGTKFHSAHIFDACHAIIDEKKADESFVYSLEEDGYRESQTTDSLGYLYRITFTTNITSIDVEKCIQLHENVCEPSKERWYDCITAVCREDIYNKGIKYVRDYFLKLKIALMTQGVTFTPSAEVALKASNGVRPATNNAVDLQINLSIDTRGKKSDDARNYLIINAPTDVKFVRFTPFSITVDDGDYWLYYYGKKLFKVILYPRDFLEDKKTKTSEIPYPEIAFLSTDRLRVHLTNSCIFKECGQGCTFCNIQPSHGVIGLEDIEEVVADYCANSRDLKLRHFLVGGQTAPESHIKKTVDIIKIIRKHAPYADIYAMVIPYSKPTISAMYEAGMTQLSCNIEVFDDNLAAKYMPGKRKKSANDYIDTLSYATTLLGRRGNVRTMLIVGLEPTDSLTKGIERITSRGIQPILSVFRALPQTPLENLISPSMEKLVSIYEQTQAICKKNGLFLGPKCVNCQNNTLALPYWMEETL